MYVEPRKMVQMNRFAGQKLRHRCREQTYGHQGGKTTVWCGWWCAELGDSDWHVYTDVYKIDDWLKKKSNYLYWKQTSYTPLLFILFLIFKREGVLNHMLKKIYIEEENNWFGF